MKKGKVLIATKIHDILSEGLAALGYECISLAKVQRSEALKVIADCIGVITSTKLTIDRELIQQAPLLKWIGRLGSGMELIDVKYAECCRISCISSPEGNANAVGEHALGVLLSLTNNIVRGNNEMHNGIWRREENRGIELEGKSIGIIGFGNTGTAFAKKLSGFDCKIIAYDKFCPENINAPVVNAVGLESIFKECDVVSFHVPLQPDTTHYFDEDFIGSMQKPFVLINTSRGTVVDTAALTKGLREGKVIGAALDVFEFEPPSQIEENFSEVSNYQQFQLAYSELLSMKNVIITPHIAGYTFEALYKMSKKLLEKIAGLNV